MKPLVPPAVGFKQIGGAAGFLLTYLLSHWLNSCGHQSPDSGSRWNFEVCLLNVTSYTESETDTSTCGAVQLARKVGEWSVNCQIVKFHSLREIDHISVKLIYFRPSIWIYSKFARIPRRFFNSVYIASGFWAKNRNHQLTHQFTRACLLNLNHEFI